MTTLKDDAMLGTKVADGVVKPEWIDANGHMNVAYYVLAFDLAVDALWEEFGITMEYIETTSGSTFAVETHVTYQRELMQGDPYVVTAQILAYDEKRIHQFQRLYHAEERFLAATGEWLNLHVNLDTRRVTPWPEAIMSRLAEATNKQSGQTWPQEAGRRMQVNKPVYSLNSEG